MTSWFRYRGLRNLHRMSHVDGTADVLRDRNFVCIDQKDLVPGDIVVLSEGMTWCDVLLVSDGTCVVDESAITGETHPQPKLTPGRVGLDTVYHPKQHKRYTVFAGTTITDMDSNIGLVLNTGSYTSEGVLLRDIVATRRSGFHVISEIAILLVILALYAVFGFYFIDDTPVYSFFWGW